MNWFPSGAFMYKFSTVSALPPYQYLHLPSVHSLSGLGSENTVNSLLSGVIEPRGHPDVGKTRIWSH